MSLYIYIYKRDISPKLRLYKWKRDTVTQRFYFHLNLDLSKIVSLSIMHNHHRASRIFNLQDLFYKILSDVLLMYNSIHLSLTKKLII